MRKPRTPSVFAVQPVWQYILAGGLLGVWTLYLGLSLPEHHTTRHWDVLWVGYDLAILAAIALTVVWLRRQLLYAVVSLTALGTLLLADAWIDVTSAHQGTGLAISLAMAGLIELPVAVIAFRRAISMLRRGVRP